MLDPFNILFLFAILIELSLLVLAIYLIVRRTFRFKAYWLLAYVLTALNSDYATAVVKIDRALGRQGSLFERVALPRDVNFIIDVSGRIALLIVIWLFLVHFVKTRQGIHAA
jgi:hypothetical protein